MEVYTHILKLLFTVVVLPVIIALTVSFNQEIEKFTFFADALKAGIFAYVLVHFFVFPLKLIYNIGQKLLGLVFRLVPVLASVVPLFFPLFTIAFLVAYGVAVKNNWHFLVEGYFAFFAGVSLMMHIILTAQSLREDDTSPAKAHYFFMMSWVYMVNLSLVVFMVSFISRNISVVNLWANALMGAKDIYLMLVRYLF